MIKLDLRWQPVFWASLGRLFREPNSRFHFLKLPPISYKEILAISKIIGVEKKTYPGLFLMYALMMCARTIKQTALASTKG
jgi:hypothetical protein